MTKFVSDLRQVGGFLGVLRFPPPINIVESGVKHHNPNPTTVNITYMHIQLYQLSFLNNILTENTDKSHYGSHRQNNFRIMNKYILVGVVYMKKHMSTSNVFFFNVQWIQL